MTDLRRITRALLSVSDKTGLVEFARALGGARRRAGLDRRHRQGARRRRARRCATSSELTGFPEMMDGRVKTLHPEGARRPARRSATTPSTPRRCSDARHRADRSAGGQPLSVRGDGRASGADFDDCIENIDIGGPAMIRAAAKNHADVAVVVDAGRLRRACSPSSTRTTARPRWRCARRSPPRPMRAPPPTTRRSPTGSPATLGDPAPGLPRLRRPARRGAALRREPAPERRRSIARREQRAGVATARQVQGKQLSYNNINDTDAAYECVAEFDPARTAAVRHHQARQSVRRRRGREPGRGLPQGAGLRSGLGLRRHRRAQPHARRRGGARHHRDLHRGDHRAGRDRGGASRSSRAKKNLRLLLAGGLPDPRARRPDGEDRSPAACWCSRATTPWSTTCDAEGR